MTSELSVLQRVFRRTKHNLLLIGGERRLDRALAQLRDWWSGPVHATELPGPLVLPTALVGAVLLRDIAALTRDQQERLFRWLDVANGRVQVISATSTDLFAAVLAGAFSDRLYYRLNV